MTKSQEIKSKFPEFFTDSPDPIEWDRCADFLNEILTIPGIMGKRVGPTSFHGEWFIMEMQIDMAKKIVSTLESIEQTIGDERSECSSQE